jgi:hypothetical protein
MLHLKDLEKIKASKYKISISRKIILKRGKINEIARIEKL